MDRRAQQDVREAKATRERLEKGSPSAGRRDFAGIINALVADAAGRELPGLAAIEGVRKQQRLAARSPASHNRSHEQFAKAVAEGFNRLHPGKRASAPVAAVTIGEDDARSQRYTPDLASARRLLDAAGRLASDPRTTRDHWTSGGQPEAIAAQFLLDAARALIAAVRAQTEREAAEDAVAGRIPLAGRR